VGLEARVAELEAALAEARTENALLREVLRRRDGELAQAHETIDELGARIAELTAQVNRNASNSSVPPSSEGLRKKPARPRKRGGRRGKQPGAPGRHLAQVEQPDRVVVHAPATCQGCGEGLAQAEVAQVVRRQVFDLPELGLEVTEHRAVRCRCACGTTTAASFPDQVAAPAGYGPGVRAAVAYLTVVHHLPVERAAQLLGDLLGTPIASGTVANIGAEAAEAVAPAVEAIRGLLAEQPVVCFDETGARIAGSLHWIHSASTGTLTLYGAHPKRGAEAMDAAGVLPAFDGVAVHDCWAPYRRYGCDHALCGAHLLRELTAAIEAGGQHWAGQMTSVLLDAKDAVAAAAAGAARLGQDTLDDIDRRYKAAVAAGHAANPPPPPSGRRGRTRKSKAANLLERLERHRDDVLRFTVDFTVPFDNNLAERDIRMVKLQQKISGCWRTLAGAQRFCATRSYISTARKHNIGVLDALRQAFAGSPWTPARAA